MRYSDKLKQAREAAVNRMTGLNETAGKEGRAFTEAEQRSWDDSKAEVAGLDAQIKSAMDREDFERNSRGGAPVLLNERGEPLTVLRGGPQMDRLADRHKGSMAADLAAEFSPGALIRGVATGRWDGRGLLQKTMNEGTGAAGQFTVPAEMSASWLDLARARSVCSAAGAIVVPMGSQTLRIAGLASDVQPAFRAELTDFPTSNNTFRALDLRARSIGVISEMSIELLADSPNASQMVETSMLAAMGLAFDQALLSGDGDVVSPKDNPLGVMNWPGIGATATVGKPTDYSPWTAAMLGIANLNHNPATVIDCPNTSYFLAGLATGITGDKTPLKAPAPYEAMGKQVTTGMASGSSLVGDFTNSGWGMREGITIEATRLSDTALTKGMVRIRCMARLDTFVTYAAAFHKLTGITYA
jgi:HK97 family phage major capsid protein